MVQPKQMNRRKFLKGLATGAGVFAVGGTIVPSSVFGADAPSNQIVMGAIGVGGRGTSDMRAMMGSSNVRMVAVCDVEKSHRDRAKAERFINDPEADRMTYRPARVPWGI